MAGETEFLNVQLMKNERKSQTLSPSSPRGVPFITAQVDFLLSETLPHRKKAATRPTTPRSSPKFYRTVRSRSGDLAFPEEPKTPRRKFDSPNVKSVPSHVHVEEEPPVAQADVYVTLSLMKTMNPVHCAGVLMKVPLFLRTLHTEGSFDPQTIASITMNLPATALTKFVGNMSQESSFYARITECTTLSDIEHVLCDLIPIQRATVWTMTENSDFLLSHTLNEVLPLRRSIVGYSVLKDTDIVTQDPGNHPGFNIDVDSSFLRNCKSMLLLPIRGATGPVAVLQVVGMCTAVSSQQIPFSEYHQEVFRIVRDIIQKRFFTATHSCELDSSIVNVFSNFQTTKFSEIATRFTKFIEKVVPCDIAEIYQFNDRAKTMTRVTDGQVFDEATGGIAFAAGMTKNPIGCYHQQKHPKFNPEIDGLLTNKSILALSVFSTRAHYVVVLRAKWKSPAFVPRDLAFLREVTPVICEALRVSSHIEKVLESEQALARKRLVAGVVCDAVNEYYSAGADAFSVLRTAARRMFESEHLFVCEFSDSEMQYRPTEIRVGFDECISGHAYNHRCLTDYTSDRFDSSTYEKLGVKMNNAVAFPFRKMESVIGAIELVNCNRSMVDDVGIDGISRLAAFALS